MAQYIFGGNTGETPQSIAQKRALVAQIMGKSVAPRTFGEGLSAIGDGIVANVTGRRADEAQAAGDASADPIKQQLIAAITGQPVPAPATPQTAVGATSAMAGGDFLTSLFDAESGGNWQALNSEGYGGRGQFGEARLADAAAAGIIPAGMTGADFSMMPPEVQQAVEAWHFNDIEQQADRMGLSRYYGQTIAGVPITPESVKAMAHLGGIGGAQKFITSGGQYNPSDSNGTSLSDYGMRFGGTGGQVPQQAGPGAGSGEMPMETLLAAVSNPFLMADPGMASVVNAMLAQQMQQMDPMHALDMDYKRAQIAKMEADAAAGPKAATSFGTPIWGSDSEGNAVFGTLDNAGNFNITETPEGFSFGKEPIRLDTGNEFTLLDPVTRQVIGTVPKDNYGSAYDTAAGSAAGKAGVEAQLGAPEAIATAQRTLTQIENLKNDPGLWWSVGGMGWTPNVPGNPQAGTISRIEQLQGASFLQAFESLKGGGQITEVEGTKATNAIARLQRSQSYEEFTQALTELQEVVQAGLERAQRQAQSGPMPLPNVAGGNAGSPGNGSGWEVVGVE